MIWRALLVSLSLHLLLLLPEYQASPRGIDSGKQLAIDVRLQKSGESRSVPKQKFTQSDRWHVPNMSSLQLSAYPAARPQENNQLALMPPRRNERARRAVLASATPSVSALQQHALEVGLAYPQEEALRQYRLALAREASRYKHFPPLARERGRGGIAVVHIRLQPGTDPDILLGQSSGYELLDEQAVSLIFRAVHAAILPEPLLGRTLAFDLTIRYTLDD